MRNFYQAFFGRFPSPKNPSGLKVLGKDFVVSPALLQQMCAKQPDLLHIVLTLGCDLGILFGVLGLVGL